MWNVLACVIVQRVGTPSAAAAVGHSNSGGGRCSGKLHGTDDGLQMSLLSGQIRA
jgi:hypothetical protein